VYQSLILYDGPLLCGFNVAIKGLKKLLPWFQETASDGKKYPVIIILGSAWPPVSHHYNICTVSLHYTAEGTEYTFTRIHVHIISNSAKAHRSWHVLWLADMRQFLSKHQSASPSLALTAGEAMYFVGTCGSYRWDGELQQPRPRHLTVSAAKLINPAASTSRQVLPSDQAACHQCRWTVLQTLCYCNI